MKESTNKSKSVDWACSEFGAADFGDKRLNKRMSKLAADLSDNPEASLTQACSDYSAMLAAYRFFSNPKVVPDKIIGPHIEQTWQRCAGQAQIIVSHDTSYLNYSNHSVSGLATLGHEKTAGLGLHTAMALTLGGLPLGILYQKSWGDEGAGKEGAEQSSVRIEGKSSYRWLEGVEEIQHRDYDGTIIHVADRESDIFEVLDFLQRGKDQFVIRSNRDRCIKHNTHRHVTDLLNDTKVLGTIETKSKSLNETITLSCKAVECSIEVPANKTKYYKDPVKCIVVEFTEESPPSNRDQIVWRIWTNISIDSLDDAIHVLKIYQLRWRIEEFHRVLKTGCRVEKLLLREKIRLRNAVALFSVVAWRIFWMNHMARVSPNEGVEAILTADEIGALTSIKRFEKKRKRKITVKNAVQLLGQLGGFIPTRAYPLPGNQTFWKGFMQFIAMTEMYRDLQ